ncbi:Ataxin-10 [Tupaia chinensis]|uniref:Ataxin-10 n=1 Tax=Tupaia chinensis TaxID=246437 RepID=L8YDU1_TUPCH|nr:Ataxin-10 [Tupaia chinensis]
MILFTSLSPERMKDLEENLNIAIDVIAAHQKQPDSEWPFLIITDHFLKSPELIEAMYAKLSNQERVTLLDLVIAKIVGEEPLTKDEVTVFLRHAELVASTFVDQCRAVLKLTAGQHTNDEGSLSAPVSTAGPSDENEDEDSTRQFTRGASPSGEAQQVAAVSWWLLQRGLGQAEPRQDPASLRKVPVSPFELRSTQLCSTKSCSLFRAPS